MTQTSPSLTDAERSMLFYCETCLVDHSGRLDSEHINSKDIETLRALQDKGLLRFGRIKFAHIPKPYPNELNWVEFADATWALVHKLRREKADRTLMPREYRTEYKGG
ncbi:MAG: hypothetical protein Q4E62_03980 [Sutterellaceae bacterium]|nr:hypothetical protein [Sutterellaceae bacterium]